MDGLTLITATGGRQASFSLLETFLSRQDYKGEVQWLVVDDVSPRTVLTMGQTVLYPEPLWEPNGRHTIARNLLVAISLIKHDKVLFVEDDDWISPSYLSVMSSRLDSSPLVGETDSHYYNVLFHRYKVWSNKTHSSLGQIGIRGELLGTFSHLCRCGYTLLDIELCRSVSGKTLYPWSGIYVGIKGMPGRPGVVRGHRMTNGGDWVSDSDLSVLRSWVGEDADLYRSYLDRQPQSMESTVLLRPESRARRNPPWLSHSAM